MSSQRIPKPNEALADFFSDNHVFADLFNAYAFYGEEILRADDLLPGDTAYVQTLNRVRGVEKIGKYRDIIRKSTLNAEYVILGLESQNRIHYAMPVRAMLYDVLGYVTECRSLGKVQEQAGWTADDTKVSGTIVSLAGILVGSEHLYRIGKEGDAVVCRTLEELEKR